MSLYSHNFQLLPRPDRSVFSSGSESTRAILPDFQTVAQLRDFTHRLLAWQYTVPSTATQTKVGASFICFLIVVVASIIARRIYEGSFWIIRTIKRPAGSLLVPNSMLIFSMVEGMFAVIFVAFLWISSDFFGSHSKPPTNYMLWLALPWCGLVFGAIWAAWGTYFARPNALQSSLDGTATSTVQRLILRPISVNAIGLFLPLAVSISVLVPGIVSNVHWQNALHMEARWQELHGQETDFTLEMVQGSQAIWYETLEATRRCSITFIIWVIHAFWIAAAFSTISFGLIRTIRAELRRQDSTKDSFQAKNSRSGLNIVEEGQDEHHGGPRANHLFSQVEMETNAPCESFFPPVRPDKIVGKQTTKMAEARPWTNEFQDPSTAASPSAAAAAATATATTTERKSRSSSEKPAKTQRDYLKSALTHIYIQTCAISPACVCFGGIALYVCLTIHAKLEHASSEGGNQFEYFFSTIILAVNWVTCLFGGVTLVAIAQKTYEPVLSTATLLPYRTHGPNAGFAIRSPKLQVHGTRSSFFETHSRNPQEQAQSSRRAKRNPLSNVEEGLELPEMNEDGEGQEEVVIEETVETYEERKKSMIMDETASTLSDPDEDYFKGGVGRSGGGKGYMS